MKPREPASGAGDGGPATSRENERGIPIAGRPTDRRSVLRAFGAAAGLAVTDLLGACAPPPAEQTPSVSVAASDLPTGERLRLEIGDHPVELRRDPDGEPHARSLLCTHTGCEVKWRADAGHYECPCHDGLFDADGRVLLGPPPAPLRDLPVAQEAGVVTVRLPPAGNA